MVKTTYFGLACDHGNSFLCLEELEREGYWKEVRTVFNVKTTTTTTIHTLAICVTILLLVPVTPVAQLLCCCILHINRSGFNYTQLYTWLPIRYMSQRGTKVNGSHHGDNPLLRPTGIQITTKSYATLQAMAPTTANVPT